MWLSVIVPVFNVGDCLIDALESISKQEKDGVQFIFIDDGSTDGSDRRLKEFHDTNPDQTIIISQENSGLSAARNAGLRHASGTYVLFMDSDDLLAPDALAICKHAISEFNSPDFISFQAESVCHKTGKTTKLTESEQSELTFRNEKEACVYAMEAYMMNGTILRHVVWNKLYRLDIIRKNHLAFTPTSEIGAEDMLFNLQYMLYVRNMVYSEDIIYRYRINRRDSLTTKQDKTENIKKHVRLALVYRDFLNDRYPGILDYRCDGNPINLILDYSVLCWLNRDFYNVSAPELVSLLGDQNDEDMLWLRHILSCWGRDKALKEIMKRNEYTGFKRHRFLLLHPSIGKHIAPIYEKIRRR